MREECQNGSSLKKLDKATEEDNTMAKL